MLPFDDHGAGRRVVLAHGFGQTRRCWGPLLPALAITHEVVAVDMPGHGEAPAVSASVEEGAGLLGETGGRAAYLGYSMGGRHVLRLAVDRPDLVTELVLIGSSPGIADPHERAARRVADDALADRVEAEGVAWFVDHWLAQPLFAGLTAATRFDDERRSNDAGALATSLRLAGTGAQEPLWDRLPEVRAPTLLVVGGADKKFAGIAHEMAMALPDARVTEIPGAGHSVHLEAPEATAAVIRHFLTP